jgi:putative Mg2+ transporter-C (MgtC) family protein
LEFLLRLGSALLLGTIVGLGRQWRQRMAGTRTNALVSIGASAFVMCAFLVRDTSRSEAQIVSYVVSGVGFLGAGVIFKDSGSVKGLNTAATIWCSAAIGATCGLGYLQYAATVAAVVLLTNTVLRPLAYRLHPTEAMTRNSNPPTCSNLSAAPRTKPTSGRFYCTRWPIRPSR